MEQISHRMKTKIVIEHEEEGEQEEVTQNRGSMYRKLTLVQATPIELDELFND